MVRRHILSLLAALPLLRGAGASAAPTPKLTAADVEAMRTGWRKLLARNAEIAKDATPVTMSDAAWKQLLSPAAYSVLRHEGTERPGSSPLNNEKRAGVYVCAGCSLPLFTSLMKFDSGTGWPSFITTIPDAFATKVDTKSIFNYTEYHCAKCGGHHGHVFDDGPPPTGNRWCENGVAMRFIPFA